MAEKKKLLDGKYGPFGANVFKNPARYLGIETCFLSQRLLLRMVRKKNWRRIQHILPIFFSQVLMQCLQKSPENYYRSLSGEI